MKYTELLEVISQIVDEEINKALGIKEEPENPKDPFGKYAFDQYRKDIKDKEQNTPIEKKAEDALSAYVGNNQKKDLDTMGPLLLNLVKQGKYKPILDPGNIRVYRILQVDTATAEKILRVKIDSEKPAGTVHNGVVLPTKSGKVSGWTANPQLIHDFSGLGSGNVMILFIARTVGNNFFGSPGKIAMAVNEPEFIPEMEVIGLGPIRFATAAYVMMYDEETSYFDTAEAIDTLLELVGIE